MPGARFANDGVDDHDHLWEGPTQQVDGQPVRDQVVADVEHESDHVMEVDTFDQHPTIVHQAGVLVHEREELACSRANIGKVRTISKPSNHLLIVDIRVGVIEMSLGDQDIVDQSHQRR